LHLLPNIQIDFQSVSNISIKNTTKPDLIFIWIGDSLPAWFDDTLKIAKKYSNANLSLICSKVAHECQQIDATVRIYNLEDFYQRDSRLYDLQYFGPLSFRDEFWLKALERYLVLLAFMKRYQIASCFQAELDNAVFDISGVGDILDLVGSGIFAPRDVLDRAVPSLIYINNILALEMLCESIFIGTDKKNDMHLLGEFLRDYPCGFSLPNESAFNAKCLWEKVDADVIGGIFDANAIGQYLLGIDPRNNPINLIARNGFINHNMQSDLSKCKFTFDQSVGLFLEMNDVKHRLINLHIHSKRMKYVLDYEKFTPILDSLANKKRTYFLGNAITKLLNHQ
jgi:hypothetical protein